MRTLFVLVLLSSTSACQIDTPACSALLSCCAGRREPSASQCREAYSVFRAHAQADLLCAEATAAYGCRPPRVDAGPTWFSDAGYSVDAPDIGVSPRFDAGAPTTDTGPRMDAPTFDQDAGPSDVGPRFYPDAGPSLDVGPSPREDAGPVRDAGRPARDAGPVFDAAF